MMIIISVKALWGEPSWGGALWGGALMGGSLFNSTLLYNYYPRGGGLLSAGYGLHKSRPSTLLENPAPPHC